MAQGLDLDMATLSLRFQQAAIGAGSWEAALGSLADITGSHCAELIGFGSRPFHVYSGMYDGVLQDFAAAGGQDLSVNSRIRVGLGAAELAVLDENDFTTEADCRRNPEYGAVIERIDIPFTCLTTLKKKPDSQLGLCVMRKRKTGNIEADQKRLFAAAAPHVLTAVSTAFALECRALTLIRQSLEALDEAALVIDASGRVQAWTPAADDLLSRGVLTIADGRLGLGYAEPSKLKAAISAAVRVIGIQDPAPSAVLAFDEKGLGFLIHVTPLPMLHGFDFDAAALVVAKPPKPLDMRVASLAGQVFRLTRAEGAVAGLLASGLSAQLIADRQGVSVGTVRTHIRRILEKSGAASQTEFVASLACRL